MGTDPRLLVSLVRSKSKCLVPSLLTMGQHVHDLSHREGVKRCEKHARQDHQGVGMSWMTQLRGPSARNICTSSCYHDEKMLRRCGGWGVQNLIVVVQITPSCISISKWQRSCWSAIILQSRKLAKGPWKVLRKVL